MEIKLERLGPTFRKQMSPACSCCGYDAEWILRIAGDRPSAEGARVGTLDKFFCERDLVNALLDACNFNCIFPSAA